MTAKAVQARSIRVGDRFVTPMGGAGDVVYLVHAVSESRDRGLVITVSDVADRDAVRFEVRRNPHEMLTLVAAS